MICRRRRLNILVGTTLVVTLSVNILFVADLITNHQTHKILNDFIARPTEVPLEPVFLKIQVLSSKDKVTVTVQDKQVYANDGSKQRGIHIVVLNQITGIVMASRVFDTYMSGSDDSMVVFLNSVSEQRIICFAIMDEGTFSLKDNGRNSLKALGSRLITSLSWRDMWAFVAVKGGEAMGENVGKSVTLDTWGLPVDLKVSIPVRSSNDPAMVCDWPDTPTNHKRRIFCANYEGYGGLCNCATPLKLHLQAPPLPEGMNINIPVAVMASNRPQYLFRMLRSLLSAHGSNASLVTVFIDGFFREPADVANLFGINAVQHEPMSERNGRISQHYRRSLSKMFDIHPSAHYILIIEEDLDVSLDLFSYFSQTVHLLDKDPTLYCISAWNDQGYEHSCNDPSLLYRVETMPGLGWILKRDLFKKELEPIWPGPDKLWDWDMWMRTDEVRKGRECIIPDISRTYHFGSSGLNMNPYFQDTYFSKHALNTVPDVTLNNVESLQSEQYELIIHELLREAVTLKHSKDPCDKNFIPKTRNKTYVVYIAMQRERDFDHWMKLATCFKLWDLDARGYHKGLWRFWLNDNHVLVVGHPYSPYSSKYKPSDVEPLHLATPKST